MAWRVGLVVLDGLGFFVVWGFWIGFLECPPVVGDVVVVFWWVGLVGFLWCGGYGFGFL
jgi:hypothetical protein